MKLSELTCKNIANVYPSERIKCYEQVKQWMRVYQKTFLQEEYTLLTKELLRREINKISENLYCLSEDVLNAYDEFMEQMHLYETYYEENDEDKIHQTRDRIIGRYFNFERKIDNRINILYRKQAILFIFVFVAAFVHTVYILLNIFQVI